MAKTYKYMMVSDTAGNDVMRGDSVWAYVPMSDGKRALALSSVEKINRNTITVRYTTGGREYTANVGGRHFGKATVANAAFVSEAI